MQEISPRKFQRDFYKISKIGGDYKIVAAGGRLMGYFTSAIFHPEENSDRVQEQLEELKLPDAPEIVKSDYDFSEPVPTPLRKRLKYGGNDSRPPKKPRPIEALKEKIEQIENRPIEANSAPKTDAVSVAVKVCSKCQNMALKSGIVWHEGEEIEVFLCMPHWKMAGRPQTFKHINQCA